MKYFYITRIELNKKNVYWTNYQHFLMVYTYISTIEMHVMVNQKFINKNECFVWHDQLDGVLCIY